MCDLKKGLRNSLSTIDQLRHFVSCWFARLVACSEVSDHAIVAAVDGNLRAGRATKARTDERCHGQGHVVRNDFDPEEIVPLVLLD